MSFEMSEAAKADYARRRNDPVILSPYDPHWPALYEKLAAEAMAACGERLVTIHHIGSTSVPGLSAKPLIDMMGELRSDADGPDCAKPLEALGYFYFGDFGIAGRHFFRQREPVHVNFHMFETGHFEIERHLVFRDALRADGARRQAYEDLKRDLAARFPNDVESYAMAKSAFVESILKELGAPERPA